MALCLEISMFSQYFVNYTISRDIYFSELPFHISDFSSISVIDEEGLSCYEMNATFDNQLFVGSGKSKKKAKLDLANKMIEIMKVVHSLFSL